MLLPPLPDGVGPVLSAAALLPGAAGDDLARGATIAVVTAVAVVALLLAVGLVLLFRRRSGAQPSSAAGMPALRTRANVLLVRADEAVTSGEDELGFAVAQFGEAATAPFTAALASAKGKVASAFALRQKLDDSVPDTDEERRAWTTEVIALCEAAEAELDAQSDDFDALRELEKNAASVLASVDRDLPALRSGRSTIQATTATLERRYSPEAIAPIATNAEQAGRLIDLATTAIADARRSLASGKSGEAALAVRTAQAATGQASQLIEAVPKFESELGRAAAGLAEEVAETRQDVAEARATGAAELEPTIAATEAALAYAEMPDRLAAPMTRGQALTLKSLAIEAYQPRQFAPDLSRAEAAKRIEALKQEIALADSF